MTCVRIPNGFLTLAPPMLKIIVGGNVIRFEDHSYCGPMPCRADGRVRDLHGRHKFWHAVSCWYQQGKKIDANGFCEWAEPPDEFEGYDHVPMGGRNFKLVKREGA